MTSQDLKLAAAAQLPFLDELNSLVTRIILGADSLSLSQGIIMEATIPEDPAATSGGEGQPDKEYI